MTGVDCGPDLIGRCDELRLIRTVVDALLSGRGGALAFAGDPGIGKSSLLAEVVTTVHAAGIPTVGCPAWSCSGAAIQEAGTGVVVVDDVHRATPEQLCAIEAVIEQAATRPVLVVLAYRPRQLPPWAVAAVARARLAARLDVRQLAPLPPETAAAVVPGHPDPDRIHHEAGGNPMYMRLLADADAELNSELFQLTPDQLAVAHTAAALGDPFGVDLLVSLSTMDSAATLAAVDALVAADLVRLAEPVPLLAFRHPAVARAVHRGIPVSRRRALHREIDRAMRDRGAPASVRAPHILQAADPACDEHLTTLVTAAEEVVERDPDLAIRWLETVRALVCEHDERWLPARLLLARARLLAGRATESREVLVGLDAAREYSGEEWAAVAVHTMRAEVQLGRYDEADALAREALAASDPPGGATAVLLTELSEVASARSDYLVADQFATAAVRVARQVGDRTEEAAALGEAAFARANRGDVSGAVRVATAAARIVDASSDAVVIRNLSALYRLGLGELLVERFADAERHLTRGLGLARRTGQRYIMPLLLKSLGDCQLRRGRLADAVETLAEVASLADREGVLPALALATGTTAHAHALLHDGDGADSRAAVDRVLAMTAGMDWSWAVVARCDAGEALIVLGDRDHGSRVLLEAAGGPTLPRVSPTRMARQCDALAAAAHPGGSARGDPGRYLALAEADPAIGATAGRAGYLHRLRMRARAGDDANARTSDAERAIAGFRAAAMPLEVCRTRLVLAAALIDAGEPTGVEDLLDAAETPAAEHGAGRLVRQIRGLRDRLPTAAGPAWRSKLTAREAEVATLAGSGLSSGEIGRKLHLSVRTVDFHLGRVYQKLGVPNRTALAVVVDP